MLTTSIFTLTVHKLYRNIKNAVNRAVWGDKQARYCSVCYVTIYRAQCMFLIGTDETPQCLVPETSLVPETGAVFSDQCSVSAD